jgi:hypothetical protein
VTNKLITVFAADLKCQIANFCLFMSAKAAQEKEKNKIVLV